MASNYTENYGLCQWEATDQVLRTEFNEDNAKVDSALKNHTDAIGTLEEKLGNCRIVHSTYIGNGSYGSGKSTGVTFPGEPPLLVMVVGRDNKLLTLHSGTVSSMSMDGTLFQVNWSGTGVSWSSVANADKQFNVNGTTYHVLMFYLI